MSIKEILSEKVSHLENLVTKMRWLSNLVADPLLQMNPTKHEFMLASIDIIDNESKSILSFKGGAEKPASHYSLNIPKYIKVSLSSTYSDLLKNYIELFDKFDNIDMRIDGVFEIFKMEKLFDLVSVGMSIMFIRELKEKQKAADDALKLYRTVSQKCNAQIYQKATDEFAVDKNANALIDHFLYGRQSINSFETFMIGTSINYCDEARVYKIMEFVSNIKNTKLGVDPVRKKFASMKRSIVQRLVTRCGLVPVCDFMTLPLLFEFLDLSFNKDKHPDENIATIPSQTEKNMGVIVIKKYHGSPITHDIRPLIDKDYIMENGLNVRPSEGINKKIARKYRTIFEVTRKSKSNIEEFTYINEDAAYVYIFETFDNFTWRILASSFDERVVAVDSIPALTKGNSLRAVAYNRIQSEGIQYIDESLAKLCRDFEESTKSIVKASYIMSAVQERLIASIKVDIAPTVYGILAQLNSLNVIDKIRENIAIVYEKHFPTKAEIGHSEENISHTARTALIAERFITSWRKAPLILTDKLLETKEAEQHINDAIMSRIKYSVKELDTDQIWSSVETSLKEHILKQKHIDIK